MLAIIPARGGSKGLPGKNLKLLLGKPLIAYAIESAIAARGIDRVIVSTESREIAEIAVRYGAECPFMRPDELATDTSLSLDTYLYTIDKIEQEENRIINEVAILQPTSPLRQAEDIEGAIELFKHKEADSVISYCEEAHPIIWHKYLTEDLRFENIFNIQERNRQEERKSYYPNGAIYIFNAKKTLRKRKYYTDKSFAYIMEKSRSVDIDTIEDFRYAEYLLSMGTTR